MDKKKQLVIEDDIKEAYQGALDIKEFVILKVNSLK